MRSIAVAATPTPPTNPIDPKSPSASPIDFDTQIIAALTRLGCNASACHGSAKGQGGFKLSLWGADADADYDAIVRQMRGRRINTHRPERSLIVLKPSEQIEHEGGYRMRRDSSAEALFIQWITQGGKRLRAKALKGLAVHMTLPSDAAVGSANRTALALLNQVGDRVVLKAVAHFSDGSSDDVTPWVRFTAEDTAAVTIKTTQKITGNSTSSETTATAKRRGQHTVLARYLDRVVAVQLLVPLGDQAKVDSTQQATNIIDRHINTKLAMLKLPVSPEVDDAGFLRRVSLDLIGRLPSPHRVRDFLSDKIENKRAALVDELLKSDAFADYWSFQFAKLFRINSKALNKEGAAAFHAWLRKQIKSNRPFDQIATALLTAEGDSHTNGAANFMRIAGDPGLVAEFASETLMGVRLRCANCHDHPLDHWKQDDYHGLAAIFAKVKRGRVIESNPRGNVTHPKTGRAATQRLPGMRSLTDDDHDGRRAFAMWLTAPTNDYFARATVNRLWQHMMGRGLVEPVDDLRSTNPATHPALLNHLAIHFAQQKYDLRATLRLIANSAAYQRSHVTFEANRVDDRFYSRAYVRPLEPEVYADAIADATGVPLAFPSFERGTRAVTLFDSLIPSATLDILGRCDRVTSCASEANASGGIDQKLHLINGELINGRVRAANGRLNQLIAKSESDEATIRSLYLTTLTRYPTAKETTFWKQQLNGQETSAKRFVFEDLFWALLSSREFTTNH